MPTSRIRPYATLVRMLEKEAFSLVLMPLFSCSLSILVALSRGRSRSFTTFATKIVFTGHGNHYCGLVKMNVKAGEKIEIALENPNLQSAKSASKTIPTLKAIDP